MERTTAPSFFPTKSRTSSLQCSILYILNDLGGDEGIPKVTNTPGSELLADLLRSELLECDRKQIGFADVQLFGPVCHGAFDEVRN